MMRLAVICLMIAGGAAQAGPPSSSLRPMARGEVSPSVVVPQRVAPVVAGEVAPEAAPEKPRRGLWKVLRPNSRPKSVTREAKAAKALRKKGAVCGDIDLQGSLIGDVEGKIAGCGVDNAIRLRSVSGVTLSQQAVMDCPTAKALKSWVEGGLKPTIGTRGGGVSGLRVAAHYACRTRNSQKGARISEHGHGRAIDIAGITLKNGSEISVLQGWDKRKDGKALRKLHKKACGPFGTVLGPESDKYHKDHFHFDTARYRSGPYCR